MTLFYKLLGVLLIVAGLPLFWTPVPVGAVLILMGLALLVANSGTARKWLHQRRRRHPRLDRWMEKSEKFMPPAFARILHRTGAHER
ncbi:MAG: hypothetical protein C0456_00120 [Hyphomonas sp.]|uniref:hypothetical protein n=1 Tax=Hyphomonas sp. TaxID=87 RepID=UPI001D537FDE|nr:hypothetical protein [Hyphomonas sp.]MBA4225007.1 hypothetical protein [Hyphomonas sp.]